jgi:hypothetical protein
MRKEQQNNSEDLDHQDGPRLPGKHKDDGTREDIPPVTLPFQVVESVNESRATVQTTERYIGCRQNFKEAVNDRFQISLANHAS